MRIVVAHNFYQQPGGEDQVFAAEVDLLRRYGHEVDTFAVHNDQVNGMTRLEALSTTVWNSESCRAIRELVRKHRAQVVHFHNTFPLISPAAYGAAREEGAAVVQTLHNFRLLSPCALLFRNGQVCEKCLGRSIAWPGILRGCYRSSRPATAAVAAMVSIHKGLRTWRDAVDLYIAPSPSARAKFIEGGIPAGKLVVKPNFLDPDPKAGDGAGKFAIFVGRLSPEKGLDTLLAAWRVLQKPPLLKIVGAGPLEELARQAASSDPNVEWLGRLAPARVYDLIGSAAMVLVPSRCYETFGRVIIEAYAKGTPVIASRLGAMADLVDHGRTGLLFEPGNPADLAARIEDLAGDPVGQLAIRRRCREEYEAQYTGALNYAKLIRIYQRAVRARSAAEAQAEMLEIEASEVRRVQ